VPTRDDGLAFLAESQPEEYALVRWIAASTPRDAVVLEATGQTYRAQEDGTYALDPTGPRIDYGDPGRVASRTGRQTPIGWPGHERQWRGEGLEVGAEINARLDMVDRVYLSGGAEESLGLLAALHATYVVVGRVERERYPADLDAHFGSFLDIVFENGNTRVYAVPVFRPLETS
jgi:uncharacterized membrane protein